MLQYSCFDLVELNNLLSEQKVTEYVISLQFNLKSLISLEQWPLASLLEHVLTVCSRSSA